MMHHARPPKQFSVELFFPREKSARWVINDPYHPDAVSCYVSGDRSGDRAEASKAIQFTTREAADNAAKFINVHGESDWRMRRSVLADVALFG